MKLQQTYQQSICYRSRTFVGCALLALGLAAPAFAQTPDEFDPGAGDIVYALAVQPDAKVQSEGALPPWADNPAPSSGA